MKKIIALVSAALLLVGCSANNQSQQTENHNGKLKVMTTFYPVYDFTKNIMGEEGEVSLLIGAGTEPHGYEPSAKDIAHMYESDAFVYLDENMEHWVEDLKPSLEEDGVVVIKGTEGITLMPGSDEDEEGDHHDHEGEEHHEEGDHHDHEGEEHHEEGDHHDGHHHEFDPHVWLSPELSIEVVNNITNQLAAAYPEKAETFKANAKAYIEKLTSLDNEYKEALKDVKTRTFVTQHAAFGYLAREFNLKQIAITGLSAEVEPSPQRLAELSDFVKENQVKYIYFEENASEKIAKTLADETGVELLVLNPLESLTQEQIDSGEDYISVMKANLQALLKTTNQ
ncbi:zinc transport system substrate-binding protein [Granulicatella balaenopterae]|uniref:Zinc transport system substrate-binding protein n=1 Tax=Granulicatella balaenopterae TaxID=137733 RepID=A0A1H9J734_9LACT|nr:zinc ABC transporter substrate-binding protein [Granulicatella balaenopterae]SEQ82425.1 zinc transport system substrate-binding protein [Granulicatella balaenopterae]